MKYDQTSKTIMCTFLGVLESSSIKSCSIAYGPCWPLDARREQAEINTTTESPNIARMELSSDIQGYCYTAASMSSINNTVLSVKLSDGVIISECTHHKVSLLAAPN